MESLTHAAPKPVKKILNDPHTYPKAFSRGGLSSYPQTDREYALVGRVFGTAFVDVTDPDNPVYLGELFAHNRAGSDWRDIKVYQDHAFIVSEANGHGMQVFDLTSLRGLPPAGGEDELLAAAHYGGFGSAHNLVINEASGFAYAVGTNNCSGGLHMVDISTPTSPVSAGCYSGDGYTHDAQCVNYTGPDADHGGKEICFAYNEDTLTIVDVTDKSNPVQIARQGYAGEGYTHQGWLDDGMELLFLDDETDELNFRHDTKTRVWDVSDLDTPLLIDVFTNTTQAIDHNQYLRGDLIFQANYRSGLRVLEVVRDGLGGYALLDEVAYFDVFPSSDSANFSGAWSNYPYFPSGTIVVSSIDEGLFVLSLDLPDAVLFVEPLDGDPPAQTTHQGTVGDRREIVTQIRVDNLTSPTLPGMPEQAAYRHLGIQSGAEAVLTGQEVRLEDRAKHQHHRHLGHAVLDGGNAQRALPAVALRDPYSQKGLGMVTAIAQLRFETFQPCRAPLVLDRRKGDAINACRPAVRTAAAVSLVEDVRPADLVPKAVEAKGRFSLSFRL